jgi:hypothetical protein
MRTVIWFLYDSVRYDSVDLAPNLCALCELLFSFRSEKQDEPEFEQEQTKTKNKTHLFRKN